MDRYLKEQNLIDKNLTSELVEGWLTSLPTTMSINTKIVYISHYTQFAEYLTSLGYTAFIPERPMENKHYVPYIFSEQEIAALIKAADDTIPTINKTGRCTAICFAVIIRMLIGCGFRLDEVLSLNSEDVDTEVGVILIKSGKGNKDRIVPVHKSLPTILKTYKDSRIPQHNGLFFPSKGGRKLSQAQARYYFNKYLEMADIQKPYLRKYERNICIHCLRHTFAVSAFRKLNPEGKDLYDETPILSTFMGHERIYGTEKYLHMTTENSEDILNLMAVLNEGIIPEVSE